MGHKNKGKDKFLRELEVKQPDIYYKYNWSEFNYITNKTDSIISDEYNRSFLTCPKELLLGRKPSITRAIDKLEYMLIDLINLGFNWVNDCDWSEFIYVNRKTKGIIIMEGDSYSLSPDSLYSGVKLSFESLLNPIDFISNKFPEYDFSKFVYNGHHNKSTIICLEHGEFFQSYNSLKRGSGCQKCGRKLQTGNYSSLYKNEPESEVYLYHIKLSYKDEYFYKIGLTKDINKRKHQFKNYKVEIIELEKGLVKDLYLMEQNMKKLFKEMNICYSPKINFAGKHECYKW